MLPTERLYYYKNNVSWPLVGWNVVLHTVTPLNLFTFSHLRPSLMKQQSGLPKPVTSSPAFRRRRTIWFLLTCIVCSIIVFSSSISLPRPSLFWSSSTEPNPLLRNALELHGLQHFVLNSGSNLHKVLYKANRDRPQGVLVHDHARNGDNENRDDGVPDPEHERLDPTKDIDLKVYSSFDGDDDWVKHVRELQTNSPLVVFSKVRFKDGFLLFHLSPGCMATGGTHHAVVRVSIWEMFLLPSSTCVLSFCSPLRRNEKLMVICRFHTCHHRWVLPCKISYGTSKVVLPVLKTRKEPHPDLRSGSSS